MKTKEIVEVSKIQDLKSNYQRDYDFGDLAEKNYLTYKENNDKSINISRDVLKNKGYNNRDKSNIKNFHLGYTETVRERAKRIRKEFNLNEEETLNVLTEKIRNNYIKMVKINSKSVFFKDKYDLNILQLIEDKFLDKLINKDLKINKNYRLQKRGVDFIERQLINNKLELTFIEVKSFKAVNKMYRKCGIEFFSKFTENQKVLGYSFFMLCDKLVYRQDICENINNDIKKDKTEKRIMIDMKRKNKDLDILLNFYTIFTEFDNFKFTELLVDYTNKLGEKFWWHSATTNGGYKSNYININYHYFDSSVITRNKYRDENENKVERKFVNTLKEVV